MAQPTARWFALHTNLGERYTPLYFLAALGNGGMAVAFFIWLNFLIPHPTTPIITFDGLTAFLPTATLPVQLLIFGALAAIVVFGLRHLRLLAWNIREYRRFRQTEAFQKLRQSNGEVTLLGLPLALTMTVNMAFAAGAVLVPGLWNIVEYLFPIAMAAFLALGIVAGRIFLSFAARVLASAEFDCAHNNSLSQLKAVLTFAMVGVGFAAPAAMSTSRATVVISIIGGLFFASAALLLFLVQFVLGFRAMLAHGIHVEHAVSLWTPLPILTVLGVAAIRLAKGLTFLFDIPVEVVAAAHVVALRNQGSPASMLVLTAVLLGLQIILAFLGYAVMQRVGFFTTYVTGTARSVGAYALVCPGTALFVFGMFFIHVGLVQTGLLPRFSPLYFALLVPAALAQLYAIRTMLRLDAKLLRPEPAPAAERQPAAA